VQYQIDAWRPEMGIVLEVEAGQGWMGKRLTAIWSERDRRCSVLVGLAGIEPATSALSVLRSNRLSYSPECPRQHVTRHLALAILPRVS
jgi:hypothetical protein